MIAFRVNFFTVLIALLVITTTAIPTQAVTTSYWEVCHQEQFSQGKPEDVAIHSDGKVTLSPLVEQFVDLEEPFVWCLAKSTDGNIYVGTGNNGKIVKISKDGQQVIWHDSEELEILSLIVGRDRHLYAGTSPGGQILKISPRGEVEVFFSTGEDHVWSLTLDQEGNLYCGTGAQGKIFKVSPNGRGELFYDTKETNVTTLVWKGKHLYAGGSGNGLIYKIDPRGQGMVLFDAQEEEISSLVFDGDEKLYAATTSGERLIGRPPAPEKPKAQEETSREDSEFMGNFVEEPMEPQESGPQFMGPSTVYQIDGLGSAQPLWTAPEGAVIFSMILGPREDLIVGTGNEGRIYSVSSDGSWSMLVDVDESQILSLLYAGEEILAGTGNLGTILRLSNQYAKKGTLESEVHDAFVVARWGRISWESSTPRGTQVTLQTRSGNSEIPDETWSSWSEVYQRAQGDMIQSPPARFIQWRANLSSSQGNSTASLEKVWLAYLQRNLAPRIQGCYIHPPGAEDSGGVKMVRRKGNNTAFGEGAQSTAGDSFGTPDWVATGERKVSWLAFDPNGDELSFHLYFRGQEEKEWKSLKEDLRSSSYSWDSHLFPDGIYYLRVEASDHPDNPEGQALSAEIISDPFVVDNTPPKVQLKGQLQGDGRYRISGEAVDELSPVVELWYSLDAEDWKPVMASDEVFDHPREEFSFVTQVVSAGEHTIVVKAMDMAGNVGAGKAVVK